MDPIVASALVAGGVSLVNNAFNIGANERNNANNERLWRMQVDESTRMWERSNEYNSPSSQMERLAVAGLSPHLIYNGKSALSPASVASTPSLSPSNASRLELDPNFALAIGQARLQKVQVDKILSDINNDARKTDADVAKSEADTAKVVAETKAIEFANTYLELDKMLDDWLKEANLESVRLNNAERRAFHEFELVGRQLDNDFKRSQITHTLAATQVARINAYVMGAKSEHEIKALKLDNERSEAENLYFSAVKGYRIALESQGLTSAQIDNKIKAIQAKYADSKGKAELVGMYVDMGTDIASVFVDAGKVVVDGVKSLKPF